MKTSETDQRPRSSGEEAPAGNNAGRERHQRVVSRVRRWQLLFAAGGTMAWLMFAGHREGVSFAAGAAASLASFGLLEKVTSAVGGNPISKSVILASVLRILLVGGALFAILQNYSLHPLAAGTGLLITVGAILVEAAFGSLLS